MKQELKPCPMCAKTENKVFSTAERRLNGTQRHHVECLLCGAKGGIRLTKEEAINAWNTRPDHSGESTEMVKGEILTTEIDWEQRRYELIKVILAKFDAEDFKSTTDSVRDKSTGSWRTLSIPPIAETQAIRIADELIKQLKKQNDE